ncbi:MAG TPA: hypothetical protein VD813_00985 [Pseudonocardia sp.]|nr:hypothetical protein [Pseudonocardia sp.]
MNPDRAREMLTAELAELDRSAAFTRRSADETATGDVTADEGPLDQHPAEFGTVIANRMESEGLARTTDEQRRRVRDALDRIDEGTYGRCTICRREIDDERLEARPEAATCRDHADADPRVPPA